MTAACWISAIHYAPPVRWNRFAFTFCTSYWKKPTPNASRSVQVFLTPLQNTSANHCMPFSSPRNSSRSAYAPPFNRIVSLHTMQNWFVAPADDWALHTLTSMFLHVYLITTVLLHTIHATGHLMAASHIVAKKWTLLRGFTPRIITPLYT